MGRPGQGRLIACSKVVTAVEKRWREGDIWEPRLDWLEVRMRRWRAGMSSHQRYVGLDSKWYHVAVKSIGSNPNSTIYQLGLGFFIGREG